MSKYFGKCFGPSTRASRASFWLRCPSFLLSKFASQLKLIQSVVRVGMLGICVTSLILRVLLSGFWVSGSQFPSPRDPFPGFWVSGSRVSGSQSPVPQSHVSGSQGPGSHGPRVPGLRVQGSEGPRVLGLRVLGSLVLILDHVLWKFISMGFWNINLRKWAPKLWLFHRFFFTILKIISIH